VNPSNGFQSTFSNASDSFRTRKYENQRKSVEKELLSAVNSGGSLRRKTKNAVVPQKHKKIFVHFRNNFCHEPRAICFVLGQFYL
jgi:hypothetical protein